MIFTRAAVFAEISGTELMNRCWRQSSATASSVQRRTGAAFGVEVFFSENQVEFIGSPPTTYEYTSAEHGRWRRLDSCPRRGTPIAVTAERRPGQRGLNGGTFDDPAWFTITRHIWVSSKLSWVAIPAAVPYRLLGST